MKKEKILIVHNYYQIPGGEDTVVENEYKLLKENGHEVVLYTKRNDEIKEYGLIKKIGLFINTIFSINTYKEVKKIIKDNGIDIVHVHNTLPLISPSVYYAAFSAKVPVIQTIHNFRFLCPAATFTRDGQICEDCLQKGLKCALKYKCYRKSFLQTLTLVLMLKIHRIIGTFNKINGYIVLTEFNKQKFKSFIKDKSKIYIKPNFTFNKLDKDQIERNINNYFVYMGRLDKIKGFNFLIETWKNIKDSELVVIGDGPEKEWAEQFVIENKIENIKLLGFMKREKAFEILKKAKALIMPSLCYETFGMSAIEAFSLGVPVIASNIGTLSIIINEKVGFLYEPYNSKELISIVKKIDHMNISELNKIAKICINEYKIKYSDYANYKILQNMHYLIRSRKG